MNKVYKTVWNDGYITMIVHTKTGHFKLMGNKRLFDTIGELEVFYKGTIKSMTLESSH